MGVRDEWLPRSFRDAIRILYHTSTALALPGRNHSDAADADGGGSTVLALPQSETTPASTGVGSAPVGDHRVSDRGR